jgi:hypothetical protein
MGDLAHFPPGADFVPELIEAFLRSTRLRPARLPNSETRLAPRPMLTVHRHLGADRREHPRQGYAARLNALEL